MRAKTQPSRTARKTPRAALKLVATVPNGAQTLARVQHKPVPVHERRLKFGDKWDYAPAPEDSKAYAIAPRHELFINGKFVAPAS